MANEGVMSLPQEQPMQGAPEGVMSLPQAQPMQEGSSAQKPQIVSSADAYEAAQTAISRINPQQLAQYKAQMRRAIEKLNPAPEQVDSMITLFEYLNQYKDQYKEILAQAIRDGDLNEGDLPPEYNPAVIGVVLLILHELRDRQRSTMQPPQGMAGGGIADMAQHLQSQGRHGDNILAHINPEEAELLRQHGGMGSINPYTGLPEFGFFSDLWKGVKQVFKPVIDVAKQIISSPIGKIIATVALTMLLGPAAGAATGMLGVGVAGTAGIVSGGLTLLGGGSVKDALISGATSYFTAGGGMGGFNPSESIAGALPGGTPSWLASGLTGAAVGTAGGILGGKSAGDALKYGLQAGVMGAAVNAGQSYFGASSTGGAPSAEGATTTPLAAPDYTPGTPIDAVGATSATPSVGTAGEQTALNTLGEQYQMVNTGGVNTGGAPGSLTPQQGSELIQSPGSVQNDRGDIVRPNGDTYRETGTGGWELVEKTSASSAPPGILQNIMKLGADPSSNTSQGYLEKAYNWVKGNAGQTDTELKQAKTDAFNTAYREARDLGQSDATALARATAAEKAAGPGILKTYGPAAGILTLGAMATGATKPYTANLEPLGPRRTGQDYINDNPEIFKNWKGWEARGAAPQLPNPIVNTPGQQPLSQPSPYVVPPNSPSVNPAGSTIPQPYNSPYSVMPIRPTRMYNVGGVVNDPDQSGGNMTPTMTNSFSGGGGMGYAAGGNSPSYPRLNGEINGRGTGTSDSIPAMLSDGEFVLTAKAVRNAGNGSRREGAKRMYKLMHMLERGGNVKGS